MLTAVAMGFSISSRFSEDNAAAAIVFTYSPQATNLVSRALPFSQGRPHPLPLRPTTGRAKPWERGQPKPNSGN